MLSVCRASVHEMQPDLSGCVSPDLWSSGHSVNISVGRVLKLLQNVGVVCLGSYLLSLVDSSSHGLQGNMEQ